MRCESDASGWPCALPGSRCGVCLERGPPGSVEPEERSAPSRFSRTRASASGCSFPVRNPELDGVQTGSFGGIEQCLRGPRDVHPGGPDVVSMGMVGRTAAKQKRAHPGGKQRRSQMPGLPRSNADDSGHADKDATHNKSPAETDGPRPAPVCTTFVRAGLSARVRHLPRGVDGTDAVLQ